LIGGWFRFTQSLSDSTLARKKRTEEVRRVFRVTLAVVLILAVTVYVLFGIIYTLVILGTTSSSLLSLSFYLRRLKREELEDVDNEM